MLFLAPPQYHLENKPPAPKISIHISILIPSPTGTLSIRGATLSNGIGYQVYFQYSCNYSVSI